MTTFDRMDEKIESRFAVGWAFPDILALGRWVNPTVGGLGALVLGGYLRRTTGATMRKIGKFSGARLRAYAVFISPFCGYVPARSRYPQPDWRPVNVQEDPNKFQSIIPIEL